MSIITEWILLNIQYYRVTHKGWDYKDDCTEFILFVSLYSWLSGTVNSILSFPTTLLSHQSHSRQKTEINLEIVVFDEF